MNTNYTIYTTTSSGLSMPQFAQSTQMPITAPQLDNRALPDYGYQCQGTGFGSNCTPCTVNDNPQGCLDLNRCTSICGNSSNLPSLGYSSISNS